MSLPLCNAGFAASFLVQRRLSGELGPCLPPGSRPLNLEDAWAIQSEVTAQLRQPIGAWKCGLPAPGRWVVAPIYANSIHRASPCLVWGRSGQVRIEPELAFILGRDLPARAEPYDVTEVDAAIESTHLALELLDQRYSADAMLTFEDKLADGLVNQGLFIGPTLASDQARGPGQIAITVTVPGSEPRCYEGHHPDENPRAPLYWLVNFLSSRGHSVRAGQAVITGSYAGAITLPLTSEVSIEYGGLGAVKVRFLAK